MVVYTFKLNYIEQGHDFLNMMVCIPDHEPK